MMPISLSFLAYMVLGMFAMKLVSIPMYTTLRRTTVVFVLLLDYYQANKVASRAVHLSVALMIAGALIAGYRDLHFDLLSYIIVGLYNLCTALYLVLINGLSTREKLQQPHSHEHAPPLDKYDFMYYNNIITIPLLTVIVATTGETRSLLQSPHASNLFFHLSLLASSLLAFLLNYAIFVNTAVNSALTQTVSGQAKDVIVVLVGYLAFADSVMDLGNAVGVTLGFAGSVAYAVAKMQPTAAAKPVASAKEVEQGEGLLDDDTAELSVDDETIDLNERRRLPAAFPRDSLTPNGSVVSHSATRHSAQT